MAEARWSLHFAWGRPPYALDLPEVVIGRGDACTLQIDEPAAALEHARFILDDEDRVWLEETGAANSTLVNGRPIPGRTELSDGDFVQIGHSVLTMRQNPNVTARMPRERAEGLATVMMESPLASSGENGRTLMMMAPSNATTVSMAVPDLAAMAAERESQRTVEVDAGAVQAGLRERESRASRPTLIGVGPTEAASEPSTVPAPPAEPAPPDRRRQSLADITPLPAPLPPPISGSVPDLGPLVKAANERLDAMRAADIGTDATQLPRERPPEVANLFTAKTQAPIETPPEVALHRRKTEPHIAVPKAESIHSMETQAMLETPSDARSRTATTRVEPLPAPPPRTTVLRQAVYLALPLSLLAVLAFWVYWSFLRP